MVRVNNGFQTWHLMQTISAAKCICDVKIINSRPFVCVEFFFFSFFKGGSTFFLALPLYLLLDGPFTTMLKTFHDERILRFVNSLYSTCRPRHDSVFFSFFQLLLSCTHLCYCNVTNSDHSFRKDWSYKCKSDELGSEGSKHW